ncbi:1019_t:CDS:2, partial [Racocetra persica]
MSSEETQIRLKEQILSLIRNKCTRWKYYECLLTITEAEELQPWSVEEEKHEFNYQRLFNLIELKGETHILKAEEFWNTNIEGIEYGKQYPDEKVSMLKGIIHILFGSLSKQTTNIIIRSLGIEEDT